MKFRELQRHILTLTKLDGTEAPVVSCYINVESGESKYRDTIEQQGRSLKRGLSDGAVRDVEEALQRIEAFLAAGLEPGTRGAAVFARAGESPFFLPLQFRVPLPTRVVVNSTPCIYDLVELKDTYSTCLVMLATENSTRILGIHVGSIVEDIWKKRPELRERGGREWTKTHYRNHRRERMNQFANEQVQALNGVVSAGGYGHWFLAGNPRVTSQIRRALPRHLAATLAGVLAAHAYDRTRDVIAATLASFIEVEERESLARVDTLLEGIGTRGQAVAGTEACLDALRKAQVDILVMAKAYQPGAGWVCDACDAGGIEAIAPFGACPACGDGRIREVETKEEMIRLAERSGSEVEIVNHSEALMRLGGVGCLLRFLRADKTCAKAA
jgi:hypothetical protein